MRRVKQVIAVVAVLVITAGSVMAGPTGPLSGYLSGGELSGNGAWVDDATVFTWNVIDNGSYFTYQYSLTVPKKDISHLIIEVSDNLSSNDIWDFTTNSGDLAPYIGSYGSSNGNPGIPDTMKGLKVDDTETLGLVFSFNSSRVPVWGDFYSKSGNDVAIWNTGFVSDDTDPSDPATSQSVRNHILVPDSVTPPIVPAPAAIILGSMGIGLVGWLRRRNAI